MKEYTIKIVSKGELSPNFGLAKDGIAYVREDLPRWVRVSVMVHELYHLDDSRKNVLLREAKAILSQLFMSFFGGIWCIVLSCSKGRLLYYLKRIKEGK